MESKIKPKATPLQVANKIDQQGTHNILPPKWVADLQEKALTVLRQHVIKQVLVSVNYQNEEQALEKHFVVDYQESETIAYIAYFKEPIQMELPYKEQHPQFIITMQLQPKTIKK